LFFSAIARNWMETIRMPHFLGLDAGGTKTFCLVGDETGAVLGFGRAGTGNYEYDGVEAAARENRKAVEAALADAGLTLADIDAIGMGVAGADVPEDYEMLERELYTPLFGGIPRTFRNDSMAGLRGGLREPYGIVIACGTGCVCAGRNRAGAETRVGGLGDAFGDMTSGSSIGRDGLQAVWQSRDNILPPTLLSELYLERSGCADLDAFFYARYRGELLDSALEPMAPLVFEAARRGDATACGILARHGEYLGMMVNGAARRLGMEHEAFHVVMAGSVFKGNAVSPVLADAMRTAIHRVCPDAQTVMPLFEPVVGALLMAMERELTITEAVYDNLAGQLKLAGARHGVSFQSSTA
jgi:N-acetylglucosamine kinase-like BadF-type ATPase